VCDRPKRMYFEPIEPPGDPAGPSINTKAVGYQIHPSSTYTAPPTTPKGPYLLDISGWVRVPIVVGQVSQQSELVVHTNHLTERTKIMTNKTTNLRKALIAGVIGIASFAIPLGAHANAKAPESCRTFSSGRTTCSYSNGSGGTSWNSYNPNSGYSSSGFRQRSGGSSWGSYDYTRPSGRSGSRSYSSWSNCWGC